MKTLIILSLLFLQKGLNKNEVTNDKKSFLISALGDFTTKSNFLVCSLISPNYTGNVVVENDDLYNYLSDSLGYSKKRYTKVVLKKLLNNEPIKINCPDIPYCKFFVVDDMETISRYSKSNTEDIVKEFFENGFLKDSVGPRQKRSVIYLLFSKGVKTKADCESGSLYISGYESTQKGSKGLER